MFSGFYTAASGMLTHQRQINVLSNNFANQKTPGFQAERLAMTTFEYEYAIRKNAQGGIDKLGKSTPMLLTRDVAVNIDSGLITDTGRSLDVAIDGAGFFNVQAADEQIYLTRNGKFDLDEEGYLIQSQGGKVLGQNGPILLGSSDFTVDQAGHVFDGNGIEIDQLKITWPDTNNLQKYTNGLYIATTAGVQDTAAADDGTGTAEGGAAGAEVAETTPYQVSNAAQLNMAGDEAVNKPLETINLRQGALESSNIDVNREYTMVMEAQRALQSCSTAIKALDQMNQKAASQIAKLV